MHKPFVLAAALAGLLGPGCEPASQTTPATADPAGACQPADCGPIAEIARVCDDGSTGTPQCSRAGDGACRWEHVCPGDKGPVAGSQGGAAPPGSAAPQAGAQPPAEGAAPAAPEAPAGFVEASSLFAQQLYGKLGAGTKGNLFFSPASISAAMALAYAGARGKTEAQIAATMHFTLPQAELHPALAAQTARIVGDGKKGPVVRIANRMWGQAGMPVEADFTKIAKEQYGAGLELVDFKTAAEPARGKINQWVSDQTSGKIKDLLPQGSLDALTRLVITNAIYFKGDWATPFDKAQTKSEAFTLGGGGAAQVPMMHRTLGTGYWDAGDAAVLELRYEGAGSGRKFSMVVILPKALDGLPKVEQVIAAGKLTVGYLAGITVEQVDVTLPRFKVSSEHDLGGTLAAMGMPLAFDDKKADFSGISKAERLYITKVAHKAFVEVNEEGTEAAAATGIVLGTKSAPPPPRIFRADHPFVFLLRDTTTGALLFMGRVTDPR